MLGVDLWTTAGLLLISLAVTLLADWLVARWQNEPLLAREGPTALVADWLVRIAWAALLAAGAVIAVRYLERVNQSAFGYALLILLALLLSLMRSSLYRRALRRAPRRLAERQDPEWHDLLPGGIAILAGLVALLLLAGFAGQQLQWPAVAVLVLGAMLPYLDKQASLLGRALPFLSRPLHQKLGHRQVWHTPFAAASLALLGLPLLVIGGWQTWMALPLGFLARTLVDLWSPPGVMLLWPFSQAHHQVPDRLLSMPGGHTQRWVAALLGVAAILLASVVGVGKEPPPPSVAPSYEQTLERYYTQRGRTFVYASVQGTWQASGRRIAGTFEVLNATGSSFVLLDRYTGGIFTAGRSAHDNLYVNSINLQTGETIRVKPADIQLAGESLASALPLLYQLQAEPGLEHIYVSGDLLLAPDSPGLPVDYSQTSLRRIEEVAPSHYRLRYLTAAELIKLAALRVETADLLIVGTYAVPATGPTVTALPAATGEALP